MTALSVKHARETKVALWAGLFAVLGAAAVPARGDFHIEFERDCMYCAGVSGTVTVDPLPVVQVVELLSNPRGILTLPDVLRFHVGETEQSFTAYRSPIPVEEPTEVTVIAKNSTAHATDLTTLLVFPIGNVLFVDAGAPADGFGSSWETAFSDLQDALSVAAECSQIVNEIRVAGGTYRPSRRTDPGDPRTVTFQLLDGIAIVGGYAGNGAPDPDWRNIARHETILSGDIGTPDDDSDNSYHVVTGYLTDPTAVLDGFTITGGYADESPPHNSGAGMYNEQSSPVVTNCTFSGNSADTGGGMFNAHSSSPEVTNCTFRGNSADSGGGMCDAYSSNPTVTNCTFSGNTGGGVHGYESDLTFVNCVLWGNSPDQIRIVSGTAVASHSCVQGGWPGTDNISDDPLLDADGVHLLEGSPCVNAGDPTGDYTGQTDMDGEGRVQQCRVDMGADETPYLNDDCNENGLDDVECDIRTGASGDCNANSVPDECETLPTIYVDDSAHAGLNDGSSWTDAFLELSSALSFAECMGTVTEIRVAGGTYRPSRRTDPSDPRTVTFQLLDGIAIVGGYAGNGAADPDERDIELYETILSGDSGTPDDDSDNSYHVVTGFNSDPTAVLDGFTITGGRPGEICGGGMYNDMGSPTVTNCTFIGNFSSVAGGGMCNIYWSFPEVTNCTFRGNAANQTAGGGMYNYMSSPTVTDCTFSGNSGCWGGGMFNEESNATVTNCTFSGNTAESGGGMGNEDSSPTVTDCTFSGNTAIQGGGMYNGFGSPTMTNCTFSGNSTTYRGGGMYNYKSSPTMTNCTFSGNTAESGGGMYNLEGSNLMTNCTFSGNTAESGGGMYNLEGSNPTIANCILWGDLPNEVFDDGTGLPTATYSNIQGGTGETWFGEGCIDADPVFIDPGYWDDNGTPGDPADDFWVGGDYRLQAGSPCIDAGFNADVPPDVLDLDGDGDTAEPIPFDLDLHPRFVDDPSAPDCWQLPSECGEAPVVDMGAYEAPTPGDCDGDGRVDLLDYEVFSACLTGPGGEATPTCRVPDLDCDGDVDAADYAAFQRFFTGSIP